MPNNLEAYLDRVKLAARLYYTDGLPQAEVARLLEASQAMVSRLLTQAREKGIVRITVEDYQPRDADLESRLRDAFPQLTSQTSVVAVVRNPVEATVHGIRRAVGYFGAPLLADRLRAAGGSVIGITGARTDLPPDLTEFIRSLRTVSGQAKLVLGFGISTPEQARQVAAIMDGFIVGSALVRAGAGGVEPVRAVAASLAAAQ